MYTKRIVLITVILGIMAFILGPMIWPSSIEEAPTAAQLPFLIVISFIEALVFGYGTAIAYTYAPRIFSSADPIATSQIRRVFISVIWLLVSWWPHDNFHRWNGHSLQGLIYIEYAFHVTLIIAGMIVAIYFFKNLNSSLIEKDSL